MLRLPRLDVDPENDNLLKVYETGLLRMCNTYGDENVTAFLENNFFGRGLDDKVRYWIDRINKRYSPPETHGNK
ncbi:hypothetical protein ACFL54_09235 [Planctomycetota bacterium]